MGTEISFLKEDAKSETAHQHARALRINGNFAIHSQPEEGTTVEAFVPLDKNAI